MNIKQVGLITYHYNHLKTEQVLLKLFRKNYDYKIFALPFKPRNFREILIKHRPDQSEAAHPQDIATKYNIPYKICDSDTDIDKGCDIYLILGTGILSAACVKEKKIVNCHPGIIPSSRGLDSFKWAIYEMKPVGVTLHYIDEKVDSGEIISVVPTDVFESDTIATLARRHYENEIEVLSQFDYYLGNPKNPFANVEVGEAKKRMNRKKEQELLNIFDKYKEKYANLKF
jgi:phosphoribosylglycinamide formyltransferase-1